jgi:hemerythrin-like domain-containing protein
MSIIETRRNLLLAAAIGGTALLPLSGCGKKGEEKDVGAVEDLMREHGVLRRALLVYQESARKIRTNAATVDADALHRAAKLFQTFGEDYHERKLEEAYIFPRVKSAGGPAAHYVDTLLAQHQRGREITQYILAQTASGKLASNAEAFAGALDAFVLMYENHAAREDTIVFPAWKAALSEHELNELGDKFEDIERQQFGGDGFDKAVAEIGAIESALGYSDLSQFTAPSPP